MVTPYSALSKLQKGTLPVRYGGVNFLDSANFDISATEIRQRVAKGCTIEGWVPDCVQQYIKQHQL